MAEVQQNLVENSIGVVGGERGNSLARTVGKVGRQYYNSDILTKLEHRRGDGLKE